MSEVFNNKSGSLAQFKNLRKQADEGAEWELLSPTDATPLGIFILVVGIDSQTYKVADRRRTKMLTKNATRNMMAGVQVKGVKRDLDFDIDPEVIEAGELDVISTCIIGWRTAMGEGSEDVVYFDDDTPMEWTPANARRLLQENPWITEQLSAFIGQRANFIKT